jgi:acetyl-CoA C-acetyltransferase
VPQRVAIVGVGYTPLRPVSPEVSFREMIFEAATKAYEDAGITPAQVDTFMSVTEDYMEGTAIADEYVPDQLGAVLKPVHTIGADGITSLGAAAMQLSTGTFNIAVIEAHSKASNVLRPAHIEAFALDPVFVRPLAFHPHFIAGMEMRAFMESSGMSGEQIAAVVEKNRRHALRNPRAAYGARVSAADVLSSPPLAEPLRELDVAQRADGAIVMVLATEDTAKKLNGKPVYIKGVGWSQDTPNLEAREWPRARYAEGAAQRAYKMAGVSNPADEIDFAEVDDAFAYKEPQHLTALGLHRANIPVNVSGGNLGCGYTHDMSGLRSVLECVLQLRGHAGERQLDRARVGLAQSWRGIPTASGGVVVLER